MEALKLDSYLAINSFVKEEKKRYSNKITSLKNALEKEYVNSLIYFEEVFNDYNAYFKNDEPHSVNKHAILANKLKSATEKLLINFKKQHSIRRCSSEQNLLFLKIVKDIQTAIELSEYFFNKLTQEAFKDINVENIPTLDCEMGNLSFGENEK